MRFSLSSVGLVEASELRPPQRSPCSAGLLAAELREATEQVSLFP
jgi:hypothetical protein